MEQLKKFPIIQVVGFKDSGKTTLVQKLIQELLKDNLQYGVLKHHGHGGPPTIQDNGTDTWKYRESGAGTTAVEGAGIFQFTSNLFDNLSLENLITFFQLLPLDGLIIEGYKQADYPKIIIIHSEEDYQELMKLSNIIAILYGNEKVTNHTQSQPVNFVLHEEERYIPYLVEWLKIEGRRMLDDETFI
jgi:molybdopterin-guanine dinucleotide biosynthesis adapter protein